MDEVNKIRLKELRDSVNLFSEKSGIMTLLFTEGDNLDNFQVMFNRDGHPYKLNFMCQELEFTIDIKNPSGAAVVYDD